jgi:predicted TIM-barrel fold metal-dependent hydrolase
MILDIHVHPPRQPDAGALENMLTVAKRAGIDRVCLLGRVGESGPDPTQDAIRQANDETMAAVRAHPGTCCGMAYLNPAHDWGFTRDEIYRTVGEGPLRGLKLWVALNARDQRLDPLMERAAELGVPVLHHSWYKTVGTTYNESPPPDIADLGRRHPETQLLMAHLSGCGWRGVCDIAPFPNISVDTCGSQPESGLVEYAVRELGAARVVFGSDATGRDFSCQLGRVLAANVSDADRQAILGGNAQRLLTTCWLGTASDGNGASGRPNLFGVAVRQRPPTSWGVLKAFP